MNHANQNSLPTDHPEDYYKDEWILNRKPIHAGGLIVEHLHLPPDTIEAEATQHHLVLYFLSGSSQRQVSRIADQKSEGVLKPGDICLKPQDASGFWHWEGTDECLVFAIDPTFLRQIAIENDCLNPSKIEIRPMARTQDSTMDLLVKQFLREMNHAEFGNKMYVESLANLFAVNFLRNYCAFTPTFKEYGDGLPNYKLRQALEYIHDHLSQSFTIEELAKLLNYSQYYFCRLFRESMGVSPYRYVLQQRVNKAKQLIENSQLSLSDIAFESGFSSHSQMTQHFRKLVGVTPKQYRDCLRW